MAEKPIELKEPKYHITTTRQELIKEESNKILSKKGFVFSTYQTEREKALKYNKSQQNNFNNTFSPIHHKITQPIMRFKPRTDLERIYDTLKQNSPSGKISNTIIQNQLTSLGFNVKTEEDNGISPEDVYGDYEENNIETERKYDKDIPDTINVEEEEENKKEDNQKTISNTQNAMSISKLRKLYIKPRVDNSNAKKLHSDLYHKTYFKALENYSLFKNTCLLPEKITSTSTTSTNLHAKHIGSSYKKTYRSKADKQNNYYINNILNPSTQIDFINLLSQSKNDKKGKFDSIEFLSKNIAKDDKGGKAGITQEQMNALKKIAFPKEKPMIMNIGSIDKKSEKDLNDLKEERITIDGVSYNKNDYENISRVVLEKCNFIHMKKSDEIKNKKQGESRSRIMSVSSGEKKYRIKG